MSSVPCMTASVSIGGSSGNAFHPTRFEPTEPQSPAAATMIWRSDAMEPLIDFGDEIRITPTDGRIAGDGMYLFTLRREDIKGASHLCAPVVMAIWDVQQLASGQLSLESANPSYPELTSMEDEATFLRLWSIRGRVMVSQRNGLGFRTMGEYY